MSSSSVSSSPSSPGWMRPDEVMKLRKQKAKRHALRARMSNSSPLQIMVPKSGSDKLSPASIGIKRKNPFSKSPRKACKIEPVISNDDSQDNTLFRFLNNSNQSQKTVAKPVYSFANILKKNLEHTKVDEPDIELWCDNLIIDWSLKTRIRFYSSQPLPWKHNFKTSEEASGTTGFVRCVTSGDQYSDNSCHLDTSSNAKFYQRCLVWQHPSIPWVQTFPRDTLKLSSQTGIFGSDAKLASCLKAEWSESLRSLHQLLRVRQCPYFYVCGPSFTCLFRASGISSISHAHAIITPTTRGFRDALKDEGISFKMPFFNNKSSDEKENDQSDEEDTNDDQEEQATSFLETLGVETSQFPSLSLSRTRVENKKYKSVDSSPLSLVYIEDMDLMGLINFLLNSTSCVSGTGPLAGVPPTLLSPVAFAGGTLKQLKAKGNLVKTSNGITQHSMELSGPIMPHSVVELTNLLKNSVDDYSISLTPVISTLPFTKVTAPEGATTQQAFALEGLIDCGLDLAVRSQMCKPPNNEEEVKSKTQLPNSYKDIQFKDHQFTWS